MDTSRKWLSPPMLMATAALMVALAALIVALAGTAGAGSLASSSKLNKPDKKQVKRIVSSQLQQLTFTPESFPAVIPAGGNGSISIGCSGNRRVVGGGGGASFAPPINPDNPKIQLISSIPLAGGSTAPDLQQPDAWRAEFHNSGAQAAYANVFAICETIP
jgi:hypothetical protein